MDNTREDFKEQHINNYKRAIIENIKNNTNILVDEDIMSLLKKPPLDSMDLIRMKFLDVAKKNKIILNIDELDKIINDYRKDVIKCLDEVRKIRSDSLCQKIENFVFAKETDILKLGKKDFSDINKKIKKEIKDQIKQSLNEKIIAKNGKLFANDIDKMVMKKVTDEVNKYLCGNYIKQISENVDFKILVKDTTLINGVKEQADRYLFTMANSRLLKEDLEKQV